MPTDPAPESPPEPRAERLASLDALRGFDMFWIVGGSAWIAHLGHWAQWDWASWLGAQMHHPDWHGFTLYDLIFPLFLFVSGVTLPWSVSARLERGDGRARVWMRVLRRGLLLVLLGCIYNGLLRFEWSSMRYASVLGRIGLAWMGAAIVVMHLRVRGQVATCLGLLVGYWVALRFVPIPGGVAGDLTMEGNLASWIDRQLLPGRLYRDVHDPEGLASTLPAIATALMGALAGRWLRRTDRGGHAKALALLAAGAVCAGIGYLWSLSFPLNKNLWTSSFALWCGGLSLGLLGLFYLWVDVWRLRPLFTFFTVIGANSILIYMVRGRLIDFELANDFLFGGALRHVADPLRDLLAVTGLLVLEWLFLLFLWRKKIFLRV